jgi:hypothetical protein
MGHLGDAGGYEPANVYAGEFADNGRFSRPQLRLDLE